MDGFCLVKSEEGIVSWKHLPPAVGGDGDIVRQVSGNPGTAPSSRSVLITAKKFPKAYTFALRVPPK